MTLLPCQYVRLRAPEQAIDGLAVAAGDLGRTPEAARAPARLRLEEVRPERLAPPDLAGAGELEALGGTSMGLLLGHQAAPVSSVAAAASAGSGVRDGGFGLRAPFRGCSTIVMLRPSRRGAASTV